MKIEFKNVHPNFGDRIIELDFTIGGNYVGIRISAGQAIVMLSDDQVEELILFLNKWKENK